MARKCKDFWACYKEYTQNTEAPEHFHFWVAVSTVAAVLKRRVWIDMKSFQWTPNFYIVLVAPPGVISKSTTINLGTRLLRKVKGVQLGSDSTTWQALAQEMAGYTEHMQFEGQYYPMSCVTLSISELGTLLNTDDREMVDVMVDLWDGRQGIWRKSTKTQGEDAIENPWINMAGCTTPAWIAANMNSTAMSGGFMSRCLFVFGHEKSKLIPYPSLEAVAHYDELQAKLINDLSHIGTHLKGPYHMTDEALAWGMEWYANHHTQDHSHLQFNAKTSGYLARKQTHIHKLAMVLSAMRKDAMVIEAQDLMEAEEWVTKLEADMPRVFQNVEAKNANLQALTVQVLERINTYEKVDRTKLYQEMFNDFKVGSADFDRIINNAIDAQVIHQLKLGRKTTLVKGPPAAPAVIAQA